MPISFTKDVDGNTTFVGPGGETKVINPEREKKNRSRAQEFLARKRASGGGDVMAFTAHDELWFIKRMSFADQAACVVSMPIGPNGFLDTSDKHKLSQFAAHLLFYGLADSLTPAPNSDNRYFVSLDEAREFTGEPAVANVVWALWTEVDRINNIVPSIKNAGPAT